LQEVDRVALAFAEQGDQHVGTGHLIAARGLHMDRSALDNALEAGGGLGVAGPIGRKPGQVLVKEFGQVVAQLVEIDSTRLQHGGGVGIVRQAKEKVFQGRILVPTIAGEGQGPMKRLFEVP